jgi:hypothetical protein
MSWGTEDHKHNAYDVYGVAEEHHRHYDLETGLERASIELDRLRARIGELEDALGEATGRIRELEAQTPQARQLQLEADLAAADLTESGYDERGEPFGAVRHGPGCLCPYCPDEEPEPEPEDYAPGPEVDDEGGMSEYRHADNLGEPW